jgi:soluble lytic murein transglycosylase
MSPEEYIREYDGIILQASKLFEVDRSLIKAVIKAESDFDHQAVSRKGAQGLMQLMPPTADAMDVENPFNPEDNILGGTRYLSLLLKRFKNNKELALAAYNAGPENVDSHQGVPPFPETENFVKKVMGYYKLYNTGSD